MLTENVFVDTGAWVALADIDDTYHKQASAIYPSLLRQYKALLTTNLVIAESYILILKGLGHKAAAQFLDGISASTRIIKVYSTEDLEREAEGILKRYADHDFSYTDAVSFAVMKKYKVKKAFSFDAHFTVMQFIKIPEMK